MNWILYSQNMWIQFIYLLNSNQILKLNSITIIKKKKKQPNGL